MNEDQTSAYLCGDGSGVFFDSNGEKIISMQKYGWGGLHLFHEKYPNAPVKILMVDDSLDIKYIELILKQIKKPKMSKTNDTVRIDTKRSR